MGLLRRYLIAGVVSLAPLLVTVVLINWLVGLSDKAIAMLPAHYRPEALLGFSLPGMGVLMALVFILLVGAITTHFIGSKMMHWFDLAMERIPLIRTVHKATRQLLNAIFSESGRAFQEVVMVQFPHEGRWVIGFVTGEGHLPGMQEGKQLVTVFVPSTPLPTTGWLLFVEPSELVHLKISVDEAMKLVLSGGMLPPEMKSRELTG